MVEHLPRHLKVKGSSLATAADTGKVNMFANVTCYDTKMEQHVLDTNEGKQLS